MCTKKQHVRHLAYHAPPSSACPAPAQRRARALPVFCRHTGQVHAMSWRTPRPPASRRQVLLLHVLRPRPDARHAAAKPPRPKKEGGEFARPEQVPAGRGHAAEEQYVQARVLTRRSPFCRRKYRRLING